MSDSQVMIHVRFAPDGTVTEIGERPKAIAAQDWFNRLSKSSVGAYQSLAGGRGLYRISQTDLDALKASSAPQAQA